MWRAFCAVVVVLSVIGGSTGALGAPRSDIGLNADELVQFFGFDQDAIQRMEQGEILSTTKADLEGSKKGLAIGLAMVIPHGIEDCTETFAGPEMFRLDPGVLDFSRIDVEDPASSFAGVGFSAEERREAKSVHAARPGSELNLSNADIAQIAAAEDANEGMRKVLSTRFRDYSLKGLRGIEPYQRSSKTTASAAEDLGMALDLSPILKRHLPDLYTYLREYPNSKPEDAEDRYYWVKREVEGRPAFSLVHWTLVVEPEFAFLSEREYYVGHTYDAMQVYFGVLPFEDSVIVFYLNRTFTDKVAGFASGLAHKIGRGRMIEAIKKNFENMRNGIEE